jgi:hypothetical protein
MTKALQQIHNRNQMVRFFDGYSEERMDEIEERKLRRPLVKTHLLELQHGADTTVLSAILSRNGIGLKPLEDGLYLATSSNHQIGDVGFVEKLSPRVLALYSVMESNPLKRLVRHVVLDNPDIDHVWLSGQTFGVLWTIVNRLSQPHRFTRLVFTHDSIFEMDKEDATDEEEEEQESTEEEASEIIERRATRFQLVDRIGVIQQKLESLQSLYSPLYAISQLRFPSPVGRGGHDFYDNGQVTNRSESFRDHRSHVLFVVRIYERLLESTEERTWYSIREQAGAPGEFRKIVGAPVTVKFNDPLSPEVFNYWIDATFKRKRNKFRLWGHPIRLGPTKVHVYGVDRHLWQPIILELTEKGCTTVIPNGTCGNTVHRLITNIQRYLVPGIEAFFGDKPYKRMVEESAEAVPYVLDAE